MKKYNLQIFRFSVPISLMFLMSVCMISCLRMAESRSSNIENTEQLTNSNTEKPDIPNQNNSHNTKNPIVSADNSIKQIDFKNFSYPWCSQKSRLKNSVTLTNGEAEIIKKNGKFVLDFTKEDIRKGNVDDIAYELDEVEYEDYNSDNVTDALITI